MAEQHSVTGQSRPQGCLLFDSGTLRFSKFISRQALHTNKLFIPRSLARKHGEELSDQVAFQVPSSTTWTVEVSKGLYPDSRFCFHGDGLKKFMDFYSLDHMYSLFFQYDGHSLFSVFIFDPSGSEIQYPLLGNSIGTEKKLHMRSPETGRKRSRSSSYSPPPLSKRNVMPAADSTRVIHHDHHGGSSSRAPDSPNSWSRGGVPVAPDSSSRKQQFEERSCSWKENSSDKLKPSSTGAPKMAAAKNPSFKVTIGKRSEYSNGTIPSSIAEVYFKKNPEVLKLQMGSKSWMVKASRRTPCRSYRMFGGWLDFARENSVGEGDVCCFELLMHQKSDDIVLKVSICRAV